MDLFLIPSQHFLKDILNGILISFCMHDLKKNIQRQGSVHDFYNWNILHYATYVTHWITREPMVMYSLTCYQGLL